MLRKVKEKKKMKEEEVNQKKSEPFESHFPSPMLVSSERYFASPFSDLRVGIWMFVL